MNVIEQIGEAGLRPRHRRGRSRNDAQEQQALKHEWSHPGTLRIISSVHSPAAFATRRQARESVGGFAPFRQRHDAAKAASCG